MMQTNYGPKKVAKSLWRKPSSSDLSQPHGMKLSGSPRVLPSIKGVVGSGGCLRRSSFDAATMARDSVLSGVWDSGLRWPLGAASLADSWEVVKILIEQGVDVKSDAGGAALIRDHSQPRASAGIARTTMLMLSAALAQLSEDTWCTGATQRSYLVASPHQIPSPWMVLLIGRVSTWTWKT